MAGIDQQAFLSCIRAALGDPAEPALLPDDLDVARVVPANADRVSVFMARAQEAGMHVHRVPDETALIEKVAQLLDAAQARTVIMPDEEMPARAQLADRLLAAGIRMLDPDDRDAAFVADVGITGVAAAVAETGSLCLLSGGQHRRLASLAVPCHVTILRGEQILPDLIDWADRQPPDPPANQVLVSAPSKTADIELALVMGVHGPRHEHVVILG